MAATAMALVGVGGIVVVADTTVVVVDRLPEAEIDGVSEVDVGLGVETEGPADSGGDSAGEDEQAAATRRSEESMRRTAAVFSHGWPHSPPDWEDLTRTISYRSLLAGPPD